MPSEASVLLYGWRSNHPLWRNQVRHKILVLDLDLNFKYLFIFQLNCHHLYIYISAKHFVCAVLINSFPNSERNACYQSLPRRSCNDTM